MNRSFPCRRDARSMLVAAALAVAALTSFADGDRAFASFSGADRQEQSVAAEPAAVAAAPAAVAAAPAARSASAVARRHAAAKQQAVQGAMARQQAEGSRRAARRAFIGGVIIGVLAGRRR